MNAVFANSLSIADALLPLLAATALGYAAARAGICDGGMATALTRFLFFVAMPILIFLTVARAPTFTIEVAPFAASFLGSTLAAAAIAYAIGRTFYRWNMQESALAIMGAAYVNSANLGVPIALAVLQSALPAILAATVQIVVVMPLILLALERGGARPGPARGAMSDILRLARNPLILSCAAGLVARQLDPRVAEGAEWLLHDLGAAAVPVALFLLGVALATIDRPSRHHASELPILIAIKLVAQPALAVAIGYFVFGLDRQWLITLWVIAGLPAPQNVLIFSLQYDVREHESRDIVFFSTLLYLLVLFAGTVALSLEY